MSSQVFDSQHQLSVEEIELSKNTYYVEFLTSFIFGADAAPQHLQSSMRRLYSFFYVRLSSDIILFNFR